MLRTFKWTSMLILTGLFLATTSQAITIGFSEIGGISANSTFTIDLVISDLETDGADVNIGAWALDITYDDTYLTAVSATFGNSLDLGHSEDLFWGTGSSKTSDYLSAIGSWYLDETSWEWDLSSQGDSFILATLTFSVADVILPDELLFELSLSSLADESGWGYIDTGEVEVNNTTLQPVPEPGTIILLGAGLVVCLAAQLRRKRMQA